MGGINFLSCKIINLIYSLYYYHKCINYNDFRVN